MEERKTNKKSFLYLEIVYTHDALVTMFAATAIKKMYYKSGKVARLQ